MIAYVFFHRRSSAVAGQDYEDALRAFHDGLDVDSASFRLRSLPFGDGRPGYEDWYMVSSWSQLGTLGDLALAPTSRTHHDAAARQATEGWGGVWALARGTDPTPPAGVAWESKPDGQSYETFFAARHGDTVWQRQLVLGPAPEFAVTVAASPDRVRVA